jgi:hypothetical protein
MKNSSSKKNSKNAPLSVSKSALETVQLNSTSSKAVKSTMTHQIAMPSSRVWDNIEKILDEQDERRSHADKLIASSFNNTKNSNHKNLYVTAVAGVSLLVGVIWVIR